MKKGLLSLIAAAALLSGCGVTDAILTNTDYEPPEEVKPFDSVVIEPVFDYEKFAGWYPDLCSQLRSCELEPVLNERVGSSDLRLTFGQVKTDIPDVFWYNGYSMHPKGQSVRLEIILLNGVEEDTVEDMYDELVKAARELVDQIPEGSTDIEKMLFVHDYICEHCSYDFNALHEEENGLWHTAYGALVQGKAVCSGYAEAFQYIMQLLGIEGGVCSGYSYRGGSHAWNYVVLDGKTYWIDATWDDGLTDASRAYFLFNDEQMLRTRWLDKSQNYAPVCDGDDGKWFRDNGAYFTEYDFDSISAYTASMSGKCELMFADYDTYKTALDDLIGKRKISKLDGVGSVASYYRDDRMYTLTLI